MAQFLDCAHCLRSFRAIQPDQKFCCRKCSREYDKQINNIRDAKGEIIPRLCIVCNTTWFVPHSKKHKICSAECRKIEVLSVAQAYYIAHKQKNRTKDPSLVCFQCKHWNIRKDSDSGGECLINRWMLCKPYLSTSKPYNPVEEE